MGVSTPKFATMAVSIPAILIGAIDAVLLFKWDVSIPKVILLSAGLGLVLFGVF